VLSSWKPVSSLGFRGCSKIELCRLFFWWGKKFLHPGPAQAPDFLVFNFEPLKCLNNISWHVIGYLEEEQFFFSKKDQHFYVIEVDKYIIMTFSCDWLRSVQHGRSV
jgi:hypothetical protein